jgi:hypothetical protein
MALPEPVKRGQVHPKDYQVCLLLLTTQLFSRLGQQDHSGNTRFAE